MAEPNNGKHKNRLPLYFTGVVTVIFLLVSTVLLFQILKVQSTHVEMEGKQDLVLETLEANQKHIMHTQEIFVNLSETLTETLDEINKNTAPFNKINNAKRS